MLLDIPIIDNSLYTPLRAGAFAIASKQYLIVLFKWCTLQQERAIKLLLVLMVSLSRFLAFILLKSTTNVCNGVCNVQCVNKKFQIKSRSYDA